MPVVQVHLKEGQPVEQKRALVARITEAMVEEVGAAQDRVHVIVTEVSTESWGRGGKLLADY